MRMAWRFPRTAIHMLQDCWRRFCALSVAPFCAAVGASGSDSGRALHAPESWAARLFAPSVALDRAQGGRTADQAHRPAHVRPNSATSDDDETRWVLRDWESWYTESEVSDILERAQALGYSLEAGSELDGFTLRDLDILVHRRQ